MKNDDRIDIAVVSRFIEQQRQLRVDALQTADLLLFLVNARESDAVNAGQSDAVGARESNSVRSGQGDAGRRNEILNGSVNAR